LAQGDRAQLPMICRVEGIELQFQSPDYTKTIINPKLRSYRIPRDVAFYLSAKEFYKVKGIPQKLITSNSVKRFLYARGETTPERFVSLLDVPVRKDTHYLTFLQAEKESLMSHLIPKGVKKELISTIHEAQGGTYENVILVRLQRTRNEIYPGGPRSAPYIVVGTSRHTKTFTYCSVTDDKLLLDIADVGGIAHTLIRTFESHIV
nr:RNA segment 1 ORF [Barley stripe mosaic virus]